MKVVRKVEGTHNVNPIRFNEWSVRKLVADKDSQRLTMTLTHFLPGGGVKMSGAGNEKAYYVISGSMIVKTKSEEVILEPGDICFIPLHEEREIRVPGPDVCTILVAIVTLENGGSP